MVEDGPEAMGELLEVVWRRVSFSPHGICPLQRSSCEAGDESGHSLPSRGSWVHIGQGEVQL